MNERIEKLAFEANRDLDGTVPFGFAEKFAELIIKECVSLFQGPHTSQLFADVSYDRGYFDGRHDGACMIKQHFGVE
jgi:hypothetical protein